MPQQEYVPNNLGLLLDPIAVEHQSRLDGVTVPAERVPAKDKAYATLVLPNVDQLVDEKSLQADIGASEAVAVIGALRMEMNMASRRHRDRSRLERPPFAPVDTDRIEIERRAEDALRKLSLPSGQGAAMFVRQC